MAFVAVAIGVGALTTVGTTMYASNQQKKAANKARGDKKTAEARVEELKESRQEILNPYRNAEDLSSLAKNLSGSMSNPYAELGVATQAAEIQMEQSDIALANTLDTLRATGASAGGATALAQAALQSKKGIAASIEGQEAQNQKLKAQGEQVLQGRKQAEEQRMQSIAFSEGQRMQGLDAAGNQYMFQQEENRLNADLDRASGVVTQSQQAIAQANQSQAAIVAGGMSAVGNIVSSGVGALGGIEQANIANTTSDRRLKKNIEKIGESLSGLNIYSFEYIDNIYGEGVYQGVMSDEIPIKAVVAHKDGYDRVDYSKLDVEFKKISNEL
tara:strand:+ start:792 stop:1778 length:987 start_codon:yes stop_codon:yes gene_type:complete